MIDVVKECAELGFVISAGPLLFCSYFNQVTKDKNSKLKNKEKSRVALRKTEISITYTEVCSRAPRFRIINLYE